MSCSATSTRDALVGGALPIDAGGPRAAIAAKVAEPLGLSAGGCGAWRAPDRRLQHDPRHQGGIVGTWPRSARLRPVAFGGNGPLFAGGMAGSLGMTRVVVPPSAGLSSSAVGLLYSDVEVHLFPLLAPAHAPARSRRVDGAWDALLDQARRARWPRGFPARAAPDSPRRPFPTRASPSSCRCRWRMARSMPSWSRQLEERYGAEHERTYGHRAGPEEPVEFVTLHVIGIGLRTARACRTACPEPRRAAAPPAPRLFRAAAGVARDGRHRRSALARPGPAR